MVRLLFLALFMIPQADALEPETIRAAQEHLEYWVNTLKTNPSPIVRKKAARMLGSMNRAEAVESLGESLEADTDHGVRLEAARALGMLGDERAFAALHAAQERDFDPAVRRASEEAIGRINSYLEYQRKEQEKLDRLRARQGGAAATTEQ